MSSDASAGETLVFARVRRSLADLRRTNLPATKGTVPAWMASYPEFEDNRVKHMEMIQGVISRLGTNSFLIKGWGITVAAAFWGFGIGEKEWGLALASLIPIALFWWLDGYFLRVERLFRALHEAVRTGEPTVEPFFMAASKTEFASKVADTSRRDVLFSETLFAFYGALVVGAAIVVAAVVIN
jgi:hypothetical protein